MSWPASGARSPADVLQLGHPGLRELSEVVADVTCGEFREQGRVLQRVLEEFRRRHGFGRAIAAPQIGIARRFLAVNLGDGSNLVVNPEITWRSEQTFSMWDDCMSFPSLLVRVRRHTSISLRYTDAEGKEQHLEALNQATSELFQHEIDHLDGVLAVDRALDKDAVVTRTAFETMPDWFLSRVDYVIPV